MQYYQFIGLLKNDDSLEKDKSPKAIREETGKILSETSAFNRRTEGNTYVFVSGVSDGTVSIGVIANRPCDYEKLCDDYLKAIGKDCERISLNEIVFEDLKSMLEEAEENHFITDAEAVLNRFDLDDLDNVFSRLSFEECMVCERDKKTVYEMGGDLIINDELLPEFDRIYAGIKLKGIEGHPVHYVIQSDDPGLYRRTAMLLMSALYGNRRISNRRFTVIDLERSEDIRRRQADCLYKSNAGGTVVIEYNSQDLEEYDCADTKRIALERICACVKKYENRVLTVFCLPRECNAIKEVLYENLANISLVEMKEELLTGERAAAFLKRLARENKVRTDKKLFAKLEDGKGYLGGELRVVLDEWFNLKLKTSAYPQYNEIACVRQEIRKAGPKGSAYEELNAMIGLEEAKRVIKQVIDYSKAQKLFASKGMMPAEISRHMIFTGNPGTAKTSVARLFARIMRENGILSRGNLIEVGRSDLVGKFVGWTAQLVKKKFEEARGSVLFIDEAYALVDDRDGSFGDEAINTIVQEMENHRNDVVVIFAGYPDKMEEFLRKNPGLRSRINYHVSFEDYDTKSLVEIAKLIARRKERTFTEEALKKLEVLFDDARQRADFGNGRYARNVVEKALVAQASRLVSMDYESVERRDVSTICAEDVEMPRTDRKNEGRRTIGFCA